MRSPSRMLVPRAMMAATALVAFLSLVLCFMSMASLAQPVLPTTPGPSLPDAPILPSTPPSVPGTQPPSSPPTGTPSSESVDASAQPTSSSGGDPDFADYKDFWGNSYEQSWKNAQSPGTEILQTTFDLTLRQHATSIPFWQHPKGNWYRHNKGKYQLASEANGLGAADTMSISGSVAADGGASTSYLESYTGTGVNVSVADQVKFYTFGVADSAGLPGTKLTNEPVTAFPSIHQLVVAEGIGLDLVPKFSPDRHKPADSSAAAGKDQIVQVVNGFISVFRKQNGELLHGPIDMRKFWVKVKGCRSPWASSPWVTFDQLAGRFIVLMTTKPRPFRRHEQMYAQAAGYTFSAADDAAYPYEDTEDYSEYRYGMDTWDGVDEDLDADDVEDWQTDLQATNDPVYNENWQTKRPKKRAPIVCLAVSQTFDALGRWDQYAFSSMSGDHKGHAWENGKLSKWPSGYFMTFDVMQSYVNKASIYGGVSATAASSSSWWSGVDTPVNVSDTAAASAADASTSTSASAAGTTDAATTAAAPTAAFPFPFPKCAPRPTPKKPKPELGSVFCAVDRRALLLECNKDKPCIPFKCAFIAHVQGCLAADLDGYLLPPPHTPELFMCPTPSRLDNMFYLYKWRVDWKQSDSLLSGPCKVKVPEHQKGCYGKEKCIQHPDHGDVHGAYGEALGPRLAFRVFQSSKKTGPAGGGAPPAPGAPLSPSDIGGPQQKLLKTFITGALVLVHTVVADGKHTINWYEFLVAGPFFKPFQINSKGFEVFDDGGKGLQSDVLGGPGVMGPLSSSGLASGPGLADPLAGMGTSSSSPGWESYDYGHGDCRYYGDYAYDGETPIGDDSLGSGGPRGMPGAGVSGAGFNAYGYSASFDPGYQYNYESDAKDYQPYQHGSCVFGKGGYGYGYDQYGCYDSKRYPWWDNQKFYLVLHQHGRLGSNDNKHRYVASAALDHVGNLAIIYQATSRVSPYLPPATFVAYRTTGYRRNYCTETDVQLHCSPDKSFVSEERRAGIDKIDIDDSSFNVLTSGDSSPVQLSASSSVPTFFDDGYTRLYSEGTYKNGCPRYQFHYHQRRLWSSLTSLVLDPCDDCTFVATAQYLKERKKKSWRPGTLGYASWHRTYGEALGADATEVASTVSDVSTTAVIPAAQKKWLGDLWNEHNDWATKLFELRFKNCIPAPLYGAFKNKKGPFKGAPGSGGYPGGYDENYSGYLNPLPPGPSNAAPCLFEKCPSLIK